MRKLAFAATAIVLVASADFAMAADAGGGWGTGGPGSASTYGGRDPGPGLNDRSVNSGQFTSGLRHHDRSYFQMFQNVPGGRFTPRGDAGRGHSNSGAASRGGGNFGADGSNNK